MEMAGPQRERSDTDRALRPSHPGWILYVVVDKLISNATTGGQGGEPAVGRAHCARDGRYAPWGGQGEGEEECRTDTGGSRLLVEVTGHSPGDGAATRVGRGAAIAAAPATQGIRQTVARRLSVGAAGVGRGRVGDWGAL